MSEKGTKSCEKGTKGAEKGAKQKKSKKAPVERTGDEMIKCYQSSIPKYVMYDGVPFPGALLTKRMADLKDFNIRPDDLIICGYPRSGNHWMKEIVTLLCADDIPVATDGNGKHAFERIPFLEMAVDLRQCLQTYMDNYFQRCGPFRPMLSKVATKFGLISQEKVFSHTFVDPLTELESRKSPRIIHTHLPYRLLPDQAKKGNCKMIYLLRNGKDVSVSFYEMHKMYPPFGYYSGDWKEFFYTYLSGKVCYGSWFEHVRDWCAQMSNTNILFVKYEDMIEDLKREVNRIATFLGKDITGATADDIADRCTFKKMKENPMSTYDGLHESIDTRTTSFLRRGKVADWKTKLTVEDSETFDHLYETTFKDDDPQIRFQLVQTEK